MTEAWNVFVSLAATQETSPDNHYDSTAENLHEIYGASERDEIWDLRPVSVGHIDPGQLIDDYTDDEADSKVEAIREASRSGTLMPPVFLVHHPDDEYPFVLIEGRHRYNAAHRERADILGAWVAHPYCSCRDSEPTHGHELSGETTT